MRCGLVTDVDECEAVPGVCHGGICLNTIGSYRCDCREGFQRNLISNTCEGQSEDFIIRNKY